MADLEHNHECNHNHPPSQSEIEPAQPEIEDEPGDRPPAQFLSKQSRRAFLASIGTASALGLSQGFKRDPADQMLDFLVTKRKMSADEAYSMISVAVDFGVTQVVGIRQGCHAAVPKSLFT
jgi:acetamidase/formamidase